MYRDSVRITSWVLAVGTLALTVACGKKQPPVTTTPTPTPTATPTATPAPPPPQTPPPPPPVPQPTSEPVLSEEALFAKWTLQDLNDTVKPLDDVLFDYDSAELNEAGRSVLQKNTLWLQKWITTRVTIEGHADARGTNEYNFALSERRAASVRDYLVSLGVAASRLAIVSKGEEQLTCTEETEACHTKNRRGHFVFTAK